MILPFPKLTPIIDVENTSQEFRISETGHVQILENFWNNSTNYLTVSGPERYVVRYVPESVPVISIAYTLPGDIIYNGFLNETAQFIIPLDVTVCDTCTARITVHSTDIYPENPAITNVIDRLIEIPIYESETYNSDGIGPNISLLHRNSFIYDSGVIFPPYELKIQFQDESGINLMGTMGHSLRYWLDDGTSEVNLNSSFNYENNSEGYCEIELTNTEPGNHYLNIEAWDNVNNRTLKEYYLFFSSNDIFRPEKIYNIPNPFSDETFFTFHLPELASVEITVFSINMRKVFSLTEMNLSPGYHAIKWNGMDSSGANISNGSYFYHFKAISSSGIEFKSIEKMVKMK